MSRMDRKAAEERFFNSLQVWTQPAAQHKEKVLEPGTDVDRDVDRMFQQLLGGRTSIPPM